MRADPATGSETWPTTDPDIHTKAAKQVATYHGTSTAKSTPGAEGDNLTGTGVLGNADTGTGGVSETGAGVHGVSTSGLGGCR